MNDWPRVELGKLIEIKHGFAFSGEYFRDTPTDDILLTPGNFQIGGGFNASKYKYYDGPVDDDYVLMPGDLLITMTDLSKHGDTLGYPAKIPHAPHGQRYLHNQRLGKVFVTAPDELDQNYLAYVLRTPEYRHEILAGATGTTVRHTSPSRILAYRIPLPPLSIQHKIADILGTLDDKIDLNHKVNATLESMARALFKSWFVDFDPVHAKAIGQTPAGMDTATAERFPDSFEDSSLGPIPRGWRVGWLDEAFEIISGGTPRTSDPKLWNGTIPWFSVRDTPSESDVFVFETEKTITELGVQNSSAKLLPLYTTIISARGTVGKLALTAVPMAINQSCYGLRGKGGYTASYIYFKAKEVVGELQRNTHGSVFDTITRETFKTSRTILPDRTDITNAFDTYTRPILERIKANLIESKSLAKLRDALLPRLMHGELLRAD